MPELIRSDGRDYSSKSFVVYPSGGVEEDGAANESQELLQLASSGLIRRVRFPNSPSGIPSGFIGDPMDPVVDIAALFLSDANGNKAVRTNGLRARLQGLGTTGEPERSCALTIFNRELHAFFISDTSGYHHFTCNGDARDFSNWTNRTANLPVEIRSFDGNIYSFRDDFRGSLYILHSPKSEIGWIGTQAGQRGSGGWIVYEYNTNRVWREISVGGADGDTVGLIPYNVERNVYSAIPSGSIQVIPSTDYALVSYKLYHNESIPLNVDIEYSIDNGVTWNDTRRFRDYNTGNRLGEGKIGLSSSPFGTSHEFFWDYVSDVGFNSGESVNIRIRPRIT
jgi:hypothetical protein